MGQLRYGDTTVVNIDDTTLAHLQTVILRKLRLHESLVLPWCDDITGARMTLWIHPGSNLVFSYTDLEPPQMDPARIRALQEHVDATGTLRLAPTHSDEPQAAGRVSARDAQEPKLRGSRDRPR